MICTELRKTTTGSDGAPQPIGMNKPTSRTSSTRTGRQLPEEVERNEAQPDEHGKKHKIDVEEDDDHFATRPSH